MNDESFWAGYCDGYAKDTYDDKEYDKLSYKEGYRVGKQDSTCVIIEDLHSSSFIEEFE